ncbi:MAG: DNA repair protein RadC [Lachnospiraceae bacterium]|jgi:DNA repair protein RadC|nr:DNA repair protein RadC [Lachnospiraceae bacterium]MEE3461601.1 DNA repair protein RadC [Lachnospiraceae bacterium]
MLKDQKNVTIKELPAERRPYEKCETYGPQSLSDAELLSVFLRTGTKKLNCTELSSKVLDSLPGRSLGGLLSVDAEELKSIEGIGRVKSIELACLGETARRVLSSRTDQGRLKFDTPDAIADHYMSLMMGLPTEEVRLLILNARLELIKEVYLSHGSFDASYLSPREVFYNAVKYKACGLVLIHNHPTGDPAPSEQDIQITRKIYNSGKVMGIKLLDHVIIGDNRYISMKEFDLLPE